MDIILGVTFFPVVRFMLIWVSLGFVTVIPKHRLYQMTQRHVDAWSLMAMGQDVFS